MKSVRLLQLKVAAASNGPTLVPPVSASRDDRLALDYPHLGALLAHVANRSKITHFEIRLHSEPGAVRWARTTACDSLVRME